MAGAEGVVLAFLDLGEPGQAAGCPDGGEAAAAPGQQLVGVALVADVPDYPVARGLEDVVQGDGQFHRPQAGRQVPAVAGDDLDYLLPDLGRKAGQLLQGEPAKVARLVDAV